MNITVLKESHKKEGRVALTPAQVDILVDDGHLVMIQKDAGLGSGFSNQDYTKVGAHVLPNYSKLILNADLIVKVKEPTLEELDYMHEGQTLFCFLHLAALPLVLKKILKTKITAIGYETVQLKDKSLPLLAPMSEIAGRLATQNGAHYLKIENGGRGVLIGGTLKVAASRVLILGGGMVGESAAKVAMGMGAYTTVLDISDKKLSLLKKNYGENLHLGLSTKKRISQLLPETDLLIGAALVPGAKAPLLVTKEMVQTMKPGSVIVDVAVDQGGCIETSRITTHEEPIFKHYGVLHYGVPNMPGSVPVTSTKALTTETYPYIRRIARFGLENALSQFAEIRSAVNCAKGKIIHPGLLSLGL